MTELKKHLKCLYENYAVVFPPIDSKLVQQGSVKLVKSGIVPIPLDYVAFLSLTNGLSWNGLELFSLNNLERAKGAFHHPGILDNFSFCQNNALMKKKLLLGYGWESLIVYDFTQKEYQLIDRYTYRLIISFPTLVAFLNHATKPLQKQLPEGL